MTDFRYGPVEFYLVGFEGERPEPATLQALERLLAGGAVRLLDFVLVAKSKDGDLTTVEVGDDLSALGMPGISLAASGLAGDEDIAEFVDVIPPGGSAAVVVVELLFQRELAANLAASGAVVLDTQRVPAPVVNALLDAYHEESEGE